METLLQFIDLINYFGDIETAKAFCENMFFNTLWNTNEHIVSACNTTWLETYE